MWRSSVSVVLSIGMILLKREVVPGMVLEQERPKFPVGLACYDDKWRGEFQNLKLAGQLRRIPHLAIAGLERRAVCRLGVDCDQKRSSCLFSWIIHFRLLASPVNCVELDWHNSAVFTLKPERMASPASSHQTVSSSLPGGRLA